MSVGTKSLSPEEERRVRTALEKLLSQAGTQRELARMLGLTPQAVSRVMTGQPAGVAFARRVADALQMSFDQLVSGRAGSERMEPRLRNLAGWDAMEAEARRRFRHIPERAWQQLGDLRTAQPPRHLTPEWIGTMASNWALAMSDDEDDEITGEKSE